MPIVETPGLQSQRQSSPTWPNLGQISLPALTFTILWPTFNLCFLIAIQLELGVLNPNLLIGTALKLYLMFTTAYLIIRALQHRFPLVLAPTRLWNQLVLHLLVLGTLGVLLGPAAPRPIPSAMAGVPASNRCGAGAYVVFANETRSIIAPPL